MQEIERLLIGLDTWPFSFVSRAVLGAMVPLLYRLLAQGENSLWLAILALILVLVALRVGSTLLRRAVPFSVSARETWAQRRRLAVRNDSYAWAKLFPMGFGFLPYALFRPGLDSSEFTVAALCVVCGGLAGFFWQQTPAAHKA